LLQVESHANMLTQQLQLSYLVHLQALEDQNRALDEEVGELRELRDREGVSADVQEMEHELKVCDSSSTLSAWRWFWLV
jgi:hypothetical protein